MWHTRMKQLATNQDRIIEANKLAQWKATVDEWQLEQNAKTLVEWKELFLAWKTNSSALKPDPYAEPIIGVYQRYVAGCHDQY
jgi:hypothetical protein